MPNLSIRAIILENYGSFKFFKQTLIQSLSRCGGFVFRTNVQKAIFYKSDKRIFDLVRENQQSLLVTRFQSLYFWIYISRLTQYHFAINISAVPLHSARDSVSLYRNGLVTFTDCSKCAAGSVNLFDVNVCFASSTVAEEASVAIYSSWRFAY